MRHADCEGDLPEGWTSTRIDTVVELNPPKPTMDALAHDALVTFVPMPAVDAVAGTMASNETRPFETVRKGYTAFRDDDVIMAKITPCMENGKAAIARRLTNGLGFGSTEFHVLRPSRAILPEYVYHYIRQESFRREAEAEMTGSVGQKRVPAEFIGGALIPLAPLAEQKRIIKRIQDLFGRVTAARERLDKVPAILKRFRQSVLAAACSGRLTQRWRASHPNVNPMAAACKELIERGQDAVKVRRGVPIVVDPPELVAEWELPSTWIAKSNAELLRAGALLDLKDGNHGANHPKVADFTDAGLPFITAAQVRDFAIDYDGAPKVSGRVLAKLRVGFSQPGDAVLTHKGTVGRAALNSRECVLTPQTTYYRCNPKYIDPNYLVYYFKSPQFFQQLSGVMSQTTRDFVPISEQYLLFIILPPREEQAEIVRQLNALFRLADEFERHVAKGIARSAKLTQAILAKAFRGELVPAEAELARREGRDYEPASILLSRAKESVKAERKRLETSSPSARRGLKDFS